MRLNGHRKDHLNVEHRLYRKDWDEAQSEDVFGKCSNPNYNGHNYELVVAVKGEIHPETGFVMDLKLLKEMIYEEVEVPFDHKNLNEELPEFKELNPTTENIAVVIWNKLRRKLKPELKLEVTLYETPRNFVTYNGE